MAEKIREIVRTMNRSIFVGERYERNMRNMARAELMICALGVVMSIVTMAQKDYATAFSPLTFVFTSVAIYYLIRVKRDRRGAVKVSILATILVLTHNVIVIPNGVSHQWALLVPLIMSYFLGIRSGVVLTAYFQLLFIFAFWTPFRERLAAHYLHIVMDRFPFLFFFNGLLTLFIMYEYHVSTLAEIDYAERLNAEVKRQTAVAVRRGDKLAQLSEQMVETLARAIDAKDAYTKGHSFRVMRYSVALAEKLGWAAWQINELRREALLHDIGKIGIPDAVLNKPEGLTEDEFHLIQSHTTIGRDILNGLECMTGSALVAGSHHERYDGKGYPLGLAGEEIPEHARLVAIADAYDAMHFSRIYREALSDGAIREEMRKQRGKQFDPAFLDAFLSLLDSGALD